jgi:hypothetical protein
LILLISCADAYMFAARNAIPKASFLSRHVCSFPANAHRQFSSITMVAPNDARTGSADRPSNQRAPEAETRREQGRVRGISAAPSPARSARVSGRAASEKAEKAIAARQGLSRKEYAAALSIAGEKAKGQSIKRQLDLAK